MAKKKGLATDYPEHVYRDRRYKNWMPYKEARAYVRNLHLKNCADWYAYCRSGKRPNTIPGNPSHVYREWQNWNDWLGTNNSQVGSEKREFLPFEEARSFARNLKFSTREQWKTYCKSGEKPDTIPTDPCRHYKDQWRGWSDWLGGVRFWVRRWKVLQCDVERVREQARMYAHALIDQEMLAAQVFQQVVAECIEEEFYTQLVTLLKAGETVCESSIGAEKVS